MKFITQSFLKDFSSYLEGKECGHLIQKKWVEGILFESDSAAIKLGNYFQYITWGILPKDQKIPQPEYMASKIKSNKGSIEGLGIEDMYDPYRLVHEKSEQVKLIFKEMGFKVIKIDWRVTKGRFRGDMDLLVECEKDLIFEDFELKAGQQIVIDAKYSGLIDDKWNEMGWVFEREEQIKYHGIQSKHYKYLVPLEFFYFVVSSGKDKDIKFIRASVTEEGIKQHVIEANALHDKFELLKDTGGFDPRPDYLKCLNCVLKENCTDKHIYPHPKTVEL